MARGLAVRFDGALLRQARANAQGSRGMTASDLASRIGATKAQVLAYEKNAVRPEPERISLLAKVLEVTPLDLVDQSERDDWTLAELRTYSGMMARDVCDAVRLSPRSYRRVENEGLIPARRYGLVAELAVCLEVGVADIELHLSNLPAVRRRSEQARELLKELYDKHLAPGLLSSPDPEDPLVAMLASLYGRPALTVAHILRDEMARLRSVQRRRASHAVAADFGATAAEQADARRGVDAETARMQRMKASLPRRMEGFFRCLLPADVWQAVALLYSLRPVALQFSPDQLMIDSAVLPAVPRHLLEVRRLGDPADSQEWLSLSDEGARHVERFRSWYDKLYPAARAVLRERERQLSGLANANDLLLHLQGADLVLFSFDGLLCRLFRSNLQTVSDNLVAVAQSMGLSVGAQTPTDPVGMLRALVRQATPVQMRYLDSVLTAHEIEAAHQAQPLPGVAALVNVLARTRRRMAVVTDHASGAAEAFLSHLAPVIGDEVLQVYGRTDDPRLLKPSPYGISLAVEAMGGERGRTLMIGESVADAVAAQAAGVSFIGVTASPRRVRLLHNAGATETVASLRALMLVARGLDTMDGHRSQQDR